MRVLVVLLLAVLFATPVLAADKAGGAPVLNNMSVQDFLKFHSDLAKKLDRKEYNRVSDKDRDIIANAQATIRQTLAGKSSMDQLSQIDRVTVFNAHERVVAAWDEAEDQRLVCKRVTKIGSHRPETVCKTVAEQEAERTDVRRENMRVRRCVGSEACGGGG